MSSESSKFANQLIGETSPYLLQHAQNPVEWYPWGEEALQKALEEDKPIILSIGYSTCHWCHVMERESFEDKSVAELMNRHYICIKIDREERPDIDQIYMDAVQAMGIQGGWPLNVFLTPDTKPFYGGTYFPQPYWKQLLETIAAAFTESRPQLEESANNFTRTLDMSEIKKYGLKDDKTTFTSDGLNTVFNALKKNFDTVSGGTAKAPKFPMPSIWHFLLNYYQHTINNDALRQVQLTLNKMARGGIYDQIGGGFSRYSTDGEWFVPHFEKMLYDNAQLLSLYADAYLVTNNKLYREIVYETFEFIEREMTSHEGGFYSALDADSEGIEGKFYVWETDELKKILEDDYAEFAAYYNIKENGNWEEGVNIPCVSTDDESYCRHNKIEISLLENKKKNWKKTLLEIRNKRIRPGLDDKILTSWNGLMISALTCAYRVFGDQKFLAAAERAADFLKEHLFSETDVLLRSYRNGHPSRAVGYAEDYAALIDAFINLYEVSFNEARIQDARKLTDYMLQYFYDEAEGMFFFTDNNAEQLIARKKELFDNVIPASNSVTALNLYRLGLHFDDKKYTETALHMIGKVKRLIETEPSHLTNWANLYAFLTQPTAEVVIIGEKALEFRKEVENVYFPNKIITGSTGESSLPLLKDRYVAGETLIYICRNKTCLLPVNSPEKAIEQLLAPFLSSNELSF